MASFVFLAVLATASLLFAVATHTRLVVLATEIEEVHTQINQLKKAQ